MGRLEAQAQGMARSPRPTYSRTLLTNWLKAGTFTGDVCITWMCSNKWAWQEALWDWYCSDVVEGFEGCQSVLAGEVREERFMFLEFPAGKYTLKTETLNLLLFMVDV